MGGRRAHLGAKGPEPEAEAEAEDVEVATPALLLPTRRGTPLHLAPDVLAGLLAGGHGLPALQLAIPHFLESPSAAAVAAGGGIRAFAGLGGLPVVAVGRDPFTPRADGLPCTSLEASFDTPAGRRKASIHCTYGLSCCPGCNKVSLGCFQIGPRLHMEVVEALQPDICVALADEVPTRAPARRNKLATVRTLDWLDACLALRQPDSCPMLGSVVGAGSLVERLHAAEETAKRDVEGFHLAGFGMGESFQERSGLLATTLSVLPSDKIRHISGCSLPEEVLQVVAGGVDLVESIYPHQLTSGGYAMSLPLKYLASSEEHDEIQRCICREHERACLGADPAKINLHSRWYRDDTRPLVEDCMCFTCRTHSRAYIHHLLNTHEMLAEVLLDVHNTWHFMGFFRHIRAAIGEHRLDHMRWRFESLFV
eukprot:SM000414S15656  [mRNA]  locus=s414:6687:11212:- [translate_table: standard]